MKKKALVHKMFSMKSLMRVFLTLVKDTMRLLGINSRKILSLKYYLRYRKNRREWISKGGKVTQNYMILSDYDDKAGNVKGHYFHQDLLVAKLIYEDRPNRHIDIGSRIDGFVAHVASFREIEVADVRPLEDFAHKNIKFIQADLMNPHDFGETDSISCLHAIEHFGLGRYTDPIDIEGHNKGIANLVNLVSKGGRLYISFPIGQNDEVHFNAHRIFRVDMIFNHPNIKKNMKLVRFDYVDDDGNLHTNKQIENFAKSINYGCGIYTFEKIND